MVLSAIADLTQVEKAFYGEFDPRGGYGNFKRRGFKAGVHKWVNLGAPALSDNDVFIKDATSTELPNNATKTYTPATDTVSPTDGKVSPITIVDKKGVLYWQLDVPRNILCHTTHNSSIVAMTVTVH